MRVCRRKGSGRASVRTYPRTGRNETGRCRQVAVAPRKHVGWLHSAPSNRTDVDQEEQPNPVSERSVASWSSGHEAVVANREVPTAATETVVTWRDIEESMDRLDKTRHGGHRHLKGRRSPRPNLLRCCVKAA
jgi:hypothetical protein